MYDKEKEKQKILFSLQENEKKEVKYTKEENFQRAIEFGIEEVNEFEKHFNYFIKSVEHLEIYQELFEEPLSSSMEKLIDNARFLITKNYTKEEKDRMPVDVFQQVKKTQERRLQLLKQIAIKYFHRPSSQQETNTND